MVDTASSVQHMATSLGRKITELQKRYEFVAMTLNGFMESCLRIQDRGPTLEMRISDALDRIVDYIDNRLVSQSLHDSVIFFFPLT